MYLYVVYIIYNINSNNKYVNESMCTYVYEAGKISILDVVQNGCLVQTGKFGHVFNFVEFGRIHFLDVIAADQNTFSGFGQFDLNLIALLFFCARRNKALEAKK